MADLDADGLRTIARQFRAVVNTPPAAFGDWLKTSESQSVGVTHKGEKVTGPGEQETVGDAMRRRILALQSRKAAELNDDDVAAMRKVVGCVHRHMRQRPDGDVTETRRRKSLMKWGHDPLKQLRRPSVTRAMDTGGACVPPASVDSVHATTKELNMGKRQLKRGQDRTEVVAADKKVCDTAERILAAIAARGDAVAGRHRSRLWALEVLAGQCGQASIRMRRYGGDSVAYAGVAG